MTAIAAPNVVLVCGGRDFGREQALYLALDKLHEDSPIDLLVHGGARGADTVAGEWAVSRGIDLVVYPANWGKFGSGGGPHRNARMLLGTPPPGLVVVAPGGRGTSDMADRASRAGVALHDLRRTL